MKAFWLFLEAWWFWIDWGTFALAILSVPSVVMRRQGRPVAAVSWILCLVGLPIVGLLLWWLIGRSHLERRRRRKRRAHDTIASRLSSIHDKLAPLPSHSPTLHSLTHLPAELVDSVFPPTSGNDVELIDAHHAFDVMEETISKAKHHVHALFYIWKDDETGRRFLDLLAARAREGVEVRVLCDAVGSPMLAAKLMRPLRKAGVKFSRFLPPQLLSLTPRLNFRNHRKIVVVDGKVGFIGGFNMADEYRREWRDLGIQVRGPAVDQLQEIFADDWYYATKEDIAASSYFGQWTRFTTNGTRSHGAAVATIASGPDTYINPIHDAIFMAINGAKERLFMMTPYFIPTSPIAAALRAAAYRGVDVRLMVPAKSDVMLVRHASRSYYRDLLDVGIRIFEYQPAMHHAKALVIDDEVSMIGSANLDNRSFRLNFEATCFVGSAELNAALCREFERDLEHSAEITSHDLDDLPMGSKLASSVAHLLSPLL